MQPQFLLFFKHGQLFGTWSTNACFQNSTQALKTNGTRSSLIFRKEMGRKQ
jgi:hypothetical protein